MIGVIGAGLVGTRVVEQLIAAGQVQVLVSDTNVGAAKRVAQRYSDSTHQVVAGPTRAMFDTNVVVLACPAPHAKAARRLLEAGVGVVSCSDDVEDTLSLLDLDAIARQARQSLVVGATSSPGLSGLLVRMLMSRFDSIDEAHVAVHGTAGPSCAQQHHRALARQSIGWHDGDWLRRPAGSGRELCWFPDPVGPRDCYRAELADPVVMHHGFPELTRVTVRVSATRRDRLTARLPMLTPPHAEGGIGALRVEVRGWRNDSRHVEVIGAADRVAHIAGSLAAACARGVVTGGFASGARVVGDSDSPNNAMLQAVVDAGIHLREFVGTSSH
ncbi:MAG: NAD(P)-binding domain-containing protein [Ilumatobacteraceae bacterium]